MIGTRLAHYEITAHLGTGGMGEVYQATDSKLGRSVAIKLLPESFTHDHDRASRFDREARVLASLNHPNIAAIHGIEESDGRKFLVMELVPGETLADRIRHGAIPLDETLGIAMQIAEALEAAHEKGVIHRDLKPANIKVTPEGKVKVLDFGLAKVLDAGHVKHSASQAPTLLSGTMPGMILGTVAYMSPEQIKGETVDQRADVWAFGCVLFEMLTGRGVISGNTNAEALSEVLKAEPNWSLLSAETPQGIRRLLRRCLRKERKERLQHIGDARIEIGEAHNDSQLDNPAAPARTIQKKSLLWVCLAALVLVVTAAIVFGRAGLLNTPAADAPIYRSLIALPDGLHFASDQSPAGRFALSPNGKTLAFVAMDAGKHSTLWVRQLDTLIAQPLGGTDGAAFPFWSPDSRNIAFLAQGQLKTIAASGGIPFRVCNAELSATGSWNRDNVILFTPKGGSPLYQVSASGGDAPIPATTLDSANGDIQHWYPFFLPDGRHFLYSAARNRTEGVAEPRAIYVGSLNSKQPAKLLVTADGNAEYVQGYLLFLRGNTLMARAFDPDRLELKGEAAPLAAVVQTSSGSVTGTAGAFSASETGLLAYQTGKDEVRSQLVWFDRTGKPMSVLGDQADYGDVAMSPDGQHAAVSVLDPALGTRDLWIYNVATGRRDRFTSDPLNEFEPIWSPDSREIVYSRLGSTVDLYSKPASGPGETAQLLEQPGLGLFPMSWSRDGKFILYVAGGAAIGRSDLWVMPLSGDKKPFEFLATPAVQNQAQFSPSGKWIVYISNKSGTFEVYVTSYPVRAADVRISTSGGMWPRWGSDGREIFYLAPDNTLTVATVKEKTSDFSVDAVRSLFPLRPRPQVSLGEFPYDVSPNSPRFLVNTFVEETTSMPITLLLNWPETLKK